MNFNKLYEDIFKPASPEEVTKRKEQIKMVRFKDWVEEYLKVKYEDLFNKENINKQNEYGYTALMYASYFNNIEIAKLLLDKGADVNVRDKYGDTALTWAIRNNNIELAKLLKQYGARE